jgi:hypothetical protein
MAAGGTHYYYCKLAASWLRPCLFQPPQLCVCGKLATGLCQTSSSIFTLALRDERVQHRGGGGGAGRSSSSSSRSRNVLCRPTDSPLLANRRLNQWTDPLLKAKSDPRVAFCRKDIRSKLLLQLVRTVTYLRAPIKISAICPAFSHSLWPPPSLHREFADLTALSVSVGLRGPKQLSSQSFGVLHSSRTPRVLPHRVAAAPARSMDTTASSYGTIVRCRRGKETSQ